MEWWQILLGVVIVILVGNGLVALLSKDKNDEDKK